VILDNVLITPKKIGAIAIQVAVEETHEDEMQVTEHPVERGAEIADHAFKRNPVVTIQCGWSNSDYAALLSTAEGTFFGGALPSSEYIQLVYSQLLELQETARPFSVMTSMRIYDSMLFKSLVVKRDPRTGNALMAQATFKAVRIVDTRVTSLPARSDQAQPAKTAETENTGVKAALPATPAPGGTVAPENM